MTFSVRKRATALIRCSRGATAVEYGLILSLIFLAAAGAIGGLAGSTTGLWSDIRTKVEQAN